MNKKILIFIILFIIPLVVAQPFQGLTSNFQEGYAIKFPLGSPIQNSPFEFEFHVYNLSDGYPITSGIGCYFHLYNPLGGHQFEGYDDTPSHNFDYAFDLDGNNFTRVGTYSYVIQCNGTSYGGYEEVFLEVTPTGRTFEIKNANLFFSALVFLSLMFILSVWTYTKIVPDEFNLWKRVGMFYIIWGLALLINYVAYVGFSNFLWEISFLGFFFKWIFFIQVYASFPLVLGSFLLYSWKLIVNEQTKRMIDHGKPYDEAYSRSVKNGLKFFRKGRYKRP